MYLMESRGVVVVWLMEIVVASKLKEGAKDGTASAWRPTLKREACKELALATSSLAGIPTR